MELKEMEMRQLEERKAEIREAVENPEADLDALESEARAINEEIETRKAEEARKAEIRDMVAAGEGEPIQTFEPEERKEMTIEEVRNSKEYVDAWAEYIKSGDDSECRKLLTTDASGELPAPILVDEIVRHAWEEDEILNRVRKTNFRGNLKVVFEKSADGAYVHNEGSTAPTEEDLQLGIVTMIPKNIKKWIRLSDEVVAMGGSSFVDFVYQEITHQIIKKLAQLVVYDITQCGTSSTDTVPYAKAVTAAPSVSVIPEAFANLSDEAENNVIIMNKLTYADFISAAASANYAIDPFMGLPVLYSSQLPAYTSASANDVYAIVGDLSGAQVNYPEGEGLALKYDDLSEAEADLVKIVGRQYAAHAVTAPGRFTNIKKPSGT